MTQTPSEHYADDRHRYRLDSRIATGGMGEVWRGTDTSLSRTVAIKLLKAEYADDATFRSRFETEARHAAALSHPGVAGVFDVGEGADTDGSGKPRPFLVMELVEGQPLSALLQAGRELDTVAVRDLMAQTGDALGAAHRAGIVHRDVKPANLMVTPTGVVKVTDFGIARAADGVGITRTGAVMGTPQYLSPEQAEGKPATVRSDVYALGVVTFECLAGRRPFEADSPVATALAHLREPVPALPPHVPSDLADVVYTALNKDPQERYADGAAFAAALRDPGNAATSVMPAVGGAGGPAAAGGAGLGAVAAGAGAGFAGGVLGGAALVGAGDDGDRTQVMGATQATAYDPSPTPADGGYGYGGPGGPLAPAPGAGPVPADDEPRRRTGLVVAAVLAAALLGVVLVLLLNSLGGDDETPVATDPTSTAASPSQTPTEESPEPTQEPTSEAPDQVTIDEDDYVGGQIDAVESSLEDLGLNVTRNEVDNDGSGTEGVVTGLNPTGTVDVGSTITVDFLGAAPEPTPTEEPEPSEDPTTDPPATTTPSDPAEVTPSDPGNSGEAPGQQKKDDRAPRADEPAKAPKPEKPDKAAAATEVGR